MIMRRGFRGTGASWFGGNGEVALRFLDHLFSLGLSTARMSKIASHVPALLHLIDLSLKDTSRSNVERVVATINSNKCWSAWTKHDKKLILRELVQYAKHGSCDRNPAYHFPIGLQPTVEPFL